MILNFLQFYILLKKYKIPWILKWQYVIMDDKVERHWYVKWLDKYPQTDAIVNNVKVLAQSPKDQQLPPITAPLLLTPSVFLPPPKETIVTTSPATTSSGSSKKNSSKKNKVILKAFLEFLNDNSDEDEEENSEASSEATVDPKR
jgi:hypothetical protein